MIVFYFILLGILCLITIAMCVWVGLSAVGIFLSAVPFVPVPAHVIDVMAKEIGPDTSPVLYDLGCGNGKVVFSLAQKIPQGRFVGIEIAPWPYLLAWIQKKIKNENNVTIIRGDIFKHDISSATHLFVYLLPKINVKLLPIIQEKCKKGTIIFTCDFPFKDLTPTKVISFDERTLEYGQNLYMYTL